VNLTRELSRLGYRLSAGIAHEYDADEELWRALEMPRHTVGAFDRIRPEDVEAACPLVLEAEALILCSFPIGPGNVENLRLAARAKRLYIVDPGAESLPRTFFVEEGRRLFDELGSRAVRLSYAELVELAESGGLAEDR
jgi:iron complex transport system ATP-binding protein